MIPQHPAYTNPALLPAIIRQSLSNTNAKRADPMKAMQRVYDLAALPDPPIRLPLGQDMITAARAEIASLTESVDKYETWSDDLDFD